MPADPNLDLLLIDDESDFNRQKYQGKLSSLFTGDLLHRLIISAGFWAFLPPKLAVPVLSAHSKAAGHSVESIYKPMLLWKLWKFRRLLRRRPRVVGITTVAIFDAAFLQRITAEVRRFSPGSLIVLGGQGAADDPAIRALGDLYISNHGEEALAALLTALKGGAEPGRAPGVTVSPEGGLTLAGSRRYEGISRALLPDWDAISSSCSCYPVEASRGCRFNCAYCIFPGRTSQVYRDPAAVVGDMRHLYETRGIREFDFLDSSLTSDTDFVLKLCAALRREKFRATWKCWARPDAFARVPELAGEMAAAGCVKVSLGIESIHEHILTKMRRGMSRAVLESGLDRVFRSGIKVYGLFVVGFPGETAETVEETTRFIAPRPFTAVYFGVFCMSKEMRALAAAEPERYCHLAGENSMDWRHDGMDYPGACGLAAEMVRRINLGKPRPVASCVEDVLRAK